MICRNRLALDLAERDGIGCLKGSARTDVEFRNYSGFIAPELEDKRAGTTDFRKRRAHQ